jgi:dTDP-4-dehydrorhamnose 3,5-epimerase
LAKIHEYLQERLVINMKFTRLSIEDVVLIEPRVFADERGLFFESYNQKQFKEFGIDFNFVQDNQSTSKKNVVRGLHFQNPPYEQGKLVSVIRGAVMDVAVDIRPSSPSFGKYITVELSEFNKRLLWIPPGFAHGFSVLEDNTTFHYKCTSLYNKSAEGGIRYDDADLKIDWGVDNPIVSEKDKILMSLKEYKLSSKDLREK